MPKPNNKLAGGVVRGVSLTLFFCLVLSLASLASAAPPAAPTNLTASTRYSIEMRYTREIILSWQDNSDNETGFSIGRGLSVSGPFIQLDTRGANSTTYSDFNLTPNTTYYYRVYAYNSSGFSAYSNVVSIKTSSASNLPPSIVSINPPTSTVNSDQYTTLTTTVSDPDGWQDLQLVLLTINSTLTFNKCLFSYYDPKHNLLYLANDAGNKWLGGFTPGSAHIIENSSARLDCSKTMVSGFLDGLQISWSISFKKTFTGEKNIYLYLRDNANAYAGWEKKGTWKINANASPSIISINPPTSTVNSDQYTTLTTIVSDPDGWQDIQLVLLTVNSSLTFNKCLFGYYDPKNNLLYLANDAGNSWLGGFTPGSNKIIENSSARLDCSKSTATGAGSNLTINWSISFKKTFTGTKDIYLYLRDNAFAYAGWEKKGTWKINANASPAIISINPPTSTVNSDQYTTLTTTLKDPDGWQDLQLVLLTINSSLTFNKCLFGYYDPKNNLLYLANDAGNSWLGGFTPGSNKIIENSSARLDCSKSTVTGTGNNLTINWSISFKNTFTGTKDIYLYLRDNAFAYAGWEKKGTMTIQPQSQDTTPPLAGQGIDSYTKLLLHFDGANGSTNFTDTLGKPVAAYGNTKINTAQSKFGSSSAFFDGSGDYLSLADSDEWNFGSGDFSIDFWVRFINLASSQYLILQRDTFNHWYVMWNGTSLVMYFYNASTEIAYYRVDWHPSINTWHHLAFVRNQTTGSIFIDGVKQNAVAQTAFGTQEVGNIAAPLLIGQDGYQGQYFNGWLDELRVSKGIARWASNFIPPAGPYTSTIKINNDAIYTNALNVTLKLSSQDNPGGSGLSQMRFSNDNSSWSTPESYAATKSWTLTQADGPKTVYVKFSDTAGNWSEPAWDTIILDTAPPAGTISINQGAATTNKQEVSLGLSAQDTGSGMGQGAQMQFSNDGSAWSSPEDYATTKPWKLSDGLGEKRVYAKFKDVTGNWSESTSTTITLVGSSFIPKERIYIYLNGQRIAMEENGKKSFYHNDHLGGTNVVTDESGQEVEYTDYQPFGEVKTTQGTLNSKKKFTGKELDESTGLYDYGARQYDARVGRFISADTVDPKLNNPQTLNRYSYTLNNPLKYIDPTGHIPIDYMTDPFFLAMSWADFETNPTFWSGVGLALDAVLTAIPYAPALGGASIRGLSRLSKADDIGKAASVVDKAEEGIRILNKVGKRGEVISKATKESGKSITVIGSLKDTAKYKGKTGFNVLEEALKGQKWTKEKNIKWLDQAIERGDEIWAVTNPKKHEALMKDKGFISEFLKTEIPHIEKKTGISVRDKFK